MKRKNPPVLIDGRLPKVGDVRREIPLKEHPEVTHERRIKQKLEEIKKQLGLKP